MTWVSLPCYDGFNAFAVWPDQNIVRYSIDLSVKISFIIKRNCGVLPFGIIKIDFYWINILYLYISVSKVQVILFKVWLQVTSCYGLFSTDLIISPKPTNRRVNIPFYPGYKYVAYPARNKEEVILIKIWRDLEY